MNFETLKLTVFVKSCVHRLKSDHRELFLSMYEGHKGIFPVSNSVFFSIAG